MKDGGTAFPVTHNGKLRANSEIASYGMTLRQWYAGLAMQGMWCNPLITKGFYEIDNQITYKVIKRMAESQADAMIEQDGKNE